MTWVCCGAKTLNRQKHLKRGKFGRRTEVSWEETKGIKESVHEVTGRLGWQVCVASPSAGLSSLTARQ